MSNPRKRSLRSQGYKSQSSSPHYIEDDQTSSSPSRDSLSSPSEPIQTRAKSRIKKMSTQDFISEVSLQLSQSNSEKSRMNPAINPRGRLLKLASSPGPTSPKRARHGNAESHNTSPIPDVALAVSSLERSGLYMDSLFDAVKTSRSAMVVVVDDWIDRYKTERKLGLLELINFIIHCCGCKGVVTPELFKDLQNAQIINQLTKEFRKDLSCYPLSMSTPEWKKFGANMSEFLSILVQRCQNNILYDEGLMDSVIPFLTGLSDSQIRAFRHTGTLAAMKLETALVRVIVNVNSQFETNKRQYETERKKGMKNRANDKLEALECKHNELLQKQEDMKDMINSLFKGVFVHRYRDSIPAIRALCMQEIGVWMKLDSDGFLTDGHLKYLGWCLNDKLGNVRLTCLKSLMGLYANKQFIPKLELFTSRFKDRILYMVLDKESDVAVEALHLLLLIQQNAEDVLIGEECCRLCTLVFAAHRALAAAAGQFLYQMLQLQYKREDGSRPLIRLLVSFFMQNKMHDHATYLVDSLWDCAATVLKDWEGMSTLLLANTKDDEEEGLSDEEESGLIEILVCCLRQAAEVHPPAGRISGRKFLSAKEKKMQQQDRIRLTEHFITVLPQLLSKFSADVDKVQNLLHVPHYFNLKVYSANRKEKHLEVLITQISNIMTKHTDSEVLQTCASVFSILIKEEYTFASRVEVSLSQMVEELSERFFQDQEELLQGGIDENDLYNVATTLKRLSALYNAKDLTHLDMFEHCCNLLTKSLKTGDAPEEIMLPALSCSFLHILWEFYNISNSTPNKEQLILLKRHVRLLCVICQECLTSFMADIREQAFIIICDLLVYFNSNIVENGRDHLKPLVYQPSVALRAELAGFVVDYVFMDKETEDSEDAEERDNCGQLEKIEHLHKRRRLLASYCKLILYNVLDLSAATDVLKYFVKFHADYGDIIKKLMSRAQEIGRIQYAKTICLSLQQLFSELSMDLEVQDITSMQEFNEIKELAQHLARTFGIYLIRVREQVFTLHREGLNFALRHPNPKGPQYPPLNIAFLEIMSEFSSKLLKQDKKMLLKYLDKVIGLQQTSSPSLTIYRKTLLVEKGKRSHHPTSVPARKHRKTQAETSNPAEDVTQLESSNLTDKEPVPLHVSTLSRPAHRNKARSVLEASDNDSLKDFVNSQPLRRPKQKKKPEAKARDSLKTPKKASQSTPSNLTSPELLEMLFPSSMTQTLSSELQLLNLMGEADYSEAGSSDLEDMESSDDSNQLFVPSTKYKKTRSLLDLFDGMDGD
ncbi:cohesin subunit SA-2-like [Erpetoichthys calabaricus]|uniref:cohesin subunit SA-2-like n=1 Tax=Erpetoichthys calabaricus TaxID=27687 RepID=UPI0022346339|nr:cohesin subunit SA-2-like [Erpetoichthys calabaricus]